MGLKEEETVERTVRVTQAKGALPTVGRCGKAISRIRRTR